MKYHGNRNFALIVIGIILLPGSFYMWKNPNSVEVVMGNIAYILFCVWIIYVGVKRDKLEIKERVIIANYSILGMPFTKTWKICDVKMVRYITGKLVIENIDGRKYALSMHLVDTLENLNKINIGA